MFSKILFFIKVLLRPRQNLTMTVMVFVTIIAINLISMAEFVAISTYFMG